MKDETVQPSSFILPPFYACLHNLQYWRNQPYLGFGAGAHGCAGGFRVANVSRIKTYIERLTNYQFPKSQSTNLPFPRSPATCNLQPVNLRIQMQETMLLGLRLTREGVSAKGFRKRFGVEMNEIFRQEIDELERLGLLEWVDLTPHPPFPAREGGAGGDRSLRLTARGRLLGNQVFIRFVG